MTRERKRYTILAIAAIVNFVHGNPYIWTVFQPYVQKEYGLSIAGSSQPFTIIIGIFAVGNMLGGFLQHRIGARATILAGSLCLCIGFGIAAVAPTDMPWMISAGYGFLGGLGSGCAFSMLVAVPQSWFPDKRGLVTGITVGVVGISGVIMNPICDYVLARAGYRTAMLMVTGIYVVLSLGAWFIKEPSKEELAQLTKNSMKDRKTGRETSREIAGEIDGETDREMDRKIDYKQDYTTLQMLRTKNFYLIAISMALAVPAYVLVNPLMKSMGMLRGLSSAQALTGVVIASFANIAGRVAAPWLSDKTGRKAVIQGLYLIALVSVLGIVWARGAAFIACISLVSLTYGGFVSVFPVLTADCFGMKYQGLNFGTVMLGYGVTSIMCPYLLAYTEGTSYGMTLSFAIAAGVCLLGMVATAYVKPGNGKIHG